MAQISIATQLFFPLPSKEADLEKKVMWVGVKNHVAGDEKMTGVRSDFHLHLKEGEKLLYGVPHIIRLDFIEPPSILIHK